VRTIDRVTIVDKIGRELQRRFGFGDIDVFLAGFGLKEPEDVTMNSKWVYSKAALAPASNDVILQIASELDIEASAKAALPPATPSRSTFAPEPPLMTEGDRLFALLTPSWRISPVGIGGNSVSSLAATIS
jgi:hypothetical protein